MSERNKQRAISELIEDLIKPEPIPTYQEEGHVKFLRSPLFALLAVLAAVVGVAQLMAVLFSKSDITDDAFYFFLFSGLALCTAGAVMGAVYSWLNKTYQDHRAAEANLAREVYVLRQNNRTQFVASLGQMDIARSAVEGAYNAQDLINAQTREERAFTAGQTLVVNAHQLDTIDRQADAEIRRLHAESENANAQDQIKFEATIRRLREIQTMGDAPDGDAEAKRKAKELQNQAWEDHRRGRR